MKQMAQEEHNDSHIDSSSLLEGEMSCLKEEVKLLSQNIQLVMQHNPDLTRLFAVS